MKKNKSYMELALNIAFEKMGMTSPNPSVGAVIVKNGKIISFGGTSEYGSHHAELVALKMASENGADVKGAEMYVSLEPCNHYGKTPPCTEAIIESGISKVYIPLADPNPLVSLKGIEKLKSAGVNVEIMNEYSDFAADIIRPFKKYITYKKPFIINKSAMTLDGRIAAMSGDSRWISSEYSRYVSHKLRAKADAIIVGKNTIIKDDPALNVRIDFFEKGIRDFFDNNRIDIHGRNNFFIKTIININIKDYNDPLRVIVGLPEMTDRGYKFMKDGNYLIFARNGEYERYIKEGNIKDDYKIIVNNGKTPGEEVEFILNELANRGIMTAVLEGGGKINGAFLDAGEIDQFIYFIAPMVAGNGISIINSRGCNKISDSVKLHDISSVMICSDILYTGYKEPCSF